MKAAGDQAEAIACAWLEARGLRLIERNHRCRGGELDLVMLDQRELVIIEVRYRRDCRYGSPEETVDLRKQRRIVVATRHYLSTTPALEYEEMRFDVVAITGTLSLPRIHWVRDAFAPA